MNGILSLNRIISLCEFVFVFCGGRGAGFFSLMMSLFYTEPTEQVLCLKWKG